MAQTPNRVDGSGLRRLRQQRGIKPAELVERVENLSTQHLRNIENGNRQASWELLHRLARALDAPIEHILSESGRRELKDAA